MAAGMKSLEAFRTEFGLNEASGPRHFGFEYVPIEELVEAWVRTAVRVLGR